MWFVSSRASESELQQREAPWGSDPESHLPVRISYSEYYFITNVKRFTYTVRKDKYTPLFYDLDQLTAVFFMVIRETKVDKDVKHYLERDQHCFIVDRGVCFE